MSLSLSSLLNPSPDSETRASPPPKDALPPPHHVQSPTELSNVSPTSSRPSSHQQTHPPTTRDEAAQALASLSASPVPPPQQWSGYTAQDSNQLERQRSWENARRQSGYGLDTMQLPPPSGGAMRKMSSPTLAEYHHVASPEHRRPSVVSPTQSAVTLAPMLPVYSPPADHVRTSNNSQADVATQHLNPHAEPSSIDTASHAAKCTRDPPAPSTDGAIQNTKTELSNTQAAGENSTPALIKQETASTPQPSSPAENSAPPNMESQTSKTLSSLKNEHGLRGQSALRDSSVPLPTTETSMTDPPAAASRKLAPPAKRKKGTASAVKKEKAPPAKKRKVEPKRSATPSSRASKGPTAKGNSLKGTPANSSPAPSARSYSGEPNEEQMDDEDEDMEDVSDSDLYCLCRKPDNGTFMIGCDGACDDWFHGKCVGIAERDKNLIDKYMCPSCTAAGIGRTTFKKMCRRSGCRLPARLGKVKSGDNSSKYCSEECGVTYFREMVARTRGREDAAKNMSSRRKSSISGPERLTIDEELGARGGALSAGEVKALLEASKTVEDFHKLGDGVLSPPATPDGTEQGKKDHGFTDGDAQALQRIATEKERARSRHALLKDRMKFVTLAKQAASRTAQGKELKPKEYCGYDSRLEWTESQFQAWRNSKSGQQAFDSETLQADKSDVADGEIPGDHEKPAICDRKKCARHHEWSKLAIDELRFEMGDNSDRMRTLATEEADINERAALRAKGGGMTEGTVEIHALAAPSGGDKMIVDPSPKASGIASSIEQPAVAEAASISTD